MKKAGLALSMLVFCVFLSGAVQAPVVHTKGFYVNDYATVLFDTHRSQILALSGRLYEDTGIQVVVLAVDSFGDLTAEEYGQAIIQGWGIGGPTGERGVLILVGVDENLARIFVGGAPELRALSTEQSVRVSTADNISKEVMNLYRPLVGEVYTAFGITPDDTVQQLLVNPRDGTTGPFNVGTAVFMAVLVLVVARSYRVSRKYRQKFLKGNVRKIKSYSRTFDEEKEYEDETKYRIDYDDMD